MHIKQMLMVALFGVITPGCFTDESGEHVPSVEVLNVGELARGEVR